MVKGGFSWSLRGTTRITFPNLLLRAQNLKVNLSLSELDTNASQACSCSTWQGMGDALSCRCWLHPWGRCRTATLCTHCFFSVYTICGHWTNCKIHFSQHLYFISYKWADAHCWFRTWYLFLLVPIWVEVHRFILECNVIKYLYLFSGHIFELRNNLWLMNWW